MAQSIRLPNAQGQLEGYELVGTTPVKPKPGIKFNRIAYSAAHVVSNPLAPHDPWAWQRPWTQRNVAWVWIGPHRSR